MKKIEPKKSNVTPIKPEAKPEESESFYSDETSALLDVLDEMDPDTRLETFEAIASAFCLDCGEILEDGECVAGCSDEDGGDESDPDNDEDEDEDDEDSVESDHE